MKKLIALLTAAVATLTSAWAATVTFDEGSNTDFSVKNATGNAGNYNWLNVSSFTIKVPAKDGLPEGTKVELSGVTIVRGNNGTSATRDTPVSITIDGITATGVQGSDADFGTGRTTTVYTFAAGSRPILTVGTAVEVTNLGRTDIRACATSSNGDTDVMIGINNNNEYQPLTKLVCTRLATATVAGGEVAFDEIAWDDEIAPSATVGALITATAPTTITLGSAKTIESLQTDGDVTIIDAKNLTMSGVSGADLTLVYDGVLPCTNSNNAEVRGALMSASWNGTVWVKNYNEDASTNSPLYPHCWGSANSKIKWTNVKGYLPRNAVLGMTGDNLASEWILEDDGDKAALTKVNGYSGYWTVIPKLSGNGTFKNSNAATQNFRFVDATEFHGSIEAENGLVVVFGTRNADASNNRIAVQPEAEVHVDKTWKATNGIVIGGTLHVTANGVIPTATGSGTIVCDGKVPNNAGLTTANWTGTLKINNNFSSCASTQIGNAGSTIEIVEGKNLTLTELTAIESKIVLGEGATLTFAKADADAYEVNAGDARDLSSIASAVTVPEGKVLSVNIKRSAAEIGSGVTKVTGATAGMIVKSGEYTAVVGEDGTATINAPVKIDGDATSFDITFNHKEDIGKSGNQNGTIDYAGVSGMNVRFDNAFELVNLDEAGEVTKNTGAHLKNHPYVQGITGFYRNTEELTFAVVGTMPNAKNTTFIHMGESRTGNDGGYGLLIATGSKDDEVIVAWNKGTEIHEISRMSVPNAASSRHVYIVTKQDDTTAGETTFTVYLDGQKWKTIDVDLFTIIGGMQVGSDFGGIIKDAYNAATEANKSKYFRQSAAEDGGVINVIRAYDRIITSAEIAQYSVPSEYPYVSPNGSSARAVEGSVNWITETAEWSNTPAGETTATPGTAPLAGAIDLTASAAATISVNLEADATCEALTLKESAMSFVKGGEGALIPTAATIGVPVTLVPTALDLSTTKTMIVGDGKIIADYSGYDVKSIYTEKSVFVTGEIDPQAEGVVTATLPTHTYRTIGELTYNATTHQYGFTVTPVMVNVEIPTVANTTVSVTAGTLNCTITDGVASVPGGADITVTYAPVAGYHFTAETPVASVTASDVTAETQIDIAGVTPVEINMYTVKVMQVEHAIATVTIGEGTPAVVTDDTVQVPHGSAFRVDYAAAEDYELVAIEGDESGLVTENYHYDRVTQNMGDYTLHFVAQLAKTATDLFLEGIAAGGEVTLTSDIEISETIVVDGMVTLNLGSSTITSTVAPLFKVTGTLTINGGTLAGPTGAEGAALDGESMITVVGGTLTYNSGTLTCGGLGSDGMYGVSVHDEGAATFGTEEGGPSISSHFAAVGANNTTAPVTITINNGSYTSAATTDNAWWFYFCAAVYAPGSGDITINGGTFSGKYGVYTRYSNVEQNLTINGGTFTSSATDIGIDTKTGSGYVGTGIRTITIGENALSIPEGYIVSEGKVVAKPTDLPGAEELPSGVSTSEYNEWAAANGITPETTQADATTAATAFVMGVTVGEGQTLAQAAEEMADDLLEEVATTDSTDFAAELQAGKLSAETVAAFETSHPGLTIGLVEAEELTSTETSKFFKLSITIKK